MVAGSEIASKAGAAVGGAGIAIVAVFRVVPAGAGAGVARVDRAEVEVVARWTIDGEGGGKVEQEGDEDGQQNRKESGARVRIHDRFPLVSVHRSRTAGWAQRAWFP
jgi:hypothetical protein